MLILPCRNGCYLHQVWYRALGWVWVRAFCCTYSRWESHLVNTTSGAIAPLLLTIALLRKCSNTLLVQSSLHACDAMTSFNSGGASMHSLSSSGNSKIKKINKHQTIKLVYTPNETFWYSFGLLWSNNASFSNKILGIPLYISVSGKITTVLKSIFITLQNENENHII